MLRNLLSIGLLLLPIVTSAEEWNLERVVTYATHSSPEAKIAYARVAEAQARLEQARSSLWPMLRMESGYTRTNTPAMVFGNVLNQRVFSPNLDFNDVPDSDNLGVRGMMEYSIFSGGSESAGRDTATSFGEAQRASQEAVGLELAFHAAANYFEIQRALGHSRAMEAMVLAHQANEKAARGAFNAGTILKTGLLDIQVQLSQARENLVRAQNAVTLATLGLRSVLGLTDQSINIAPHDSLALSPPNEPFRPEAVPTVVAATQIQQGMLSAVEKARGDFFPKIKLQAGYEYNRGWELDGEGSGYFGGVVATWSVFDGQLTRERVSEAEAASDAARELARRTETSARLALQQSEVRYSEAVARLEIVRESQRLAAENASLTRMRFGEGLATSTQLVEAERALTAAEVNTVDADADRKLGLIALYRAYGLSPLGTTRKGGTPQ